MKLIIVLTILCAAATYAAPQTQARGGYNGDPASAEIVKYESENIGIDGYKFAFDTSDGQSRSEQAQLKNVGTDAEALVVQGSFSWIAPDGQQYTVTFIADENGFQPQGAHLPKALV